ncbi:MAG: hypothetical protein PUG67_02095 [Peptoniphilaceae bacterium]|nr:hypothetical protein [Peptoniphilaceae bacterium]MDY6018876.1 hypothetical protein [Anaerococcus sp.]
MTSKEKHDAWQKKLACPLLIVDGSMPIRENFELVKRKIKI